MGDVIIHVEKAAETVDIDEAKRLEEKMRRGQFTLEDFLDQLRQMKSSAPWKALSACCPAVQK